MAQTIGATVKTGQYRRIVKILADIHKLRSIAAASGCKEIWEKLNAACMQFEKPRFNSQTGAAERKGEGCRRVRALLRVGSEEDELCESMGHQDST
jgi:hypothetical protein